MQKLAWDPTLTFTTATPTLTVDVGEAWLSNGVVFLAYEANSTDGAGATALTITPPIIPQHSDVYYPLTGWELIATTYSAPLGYIDSGQATAEDRLIKFFNHGTATDDAVYKIAFSGFYPLINMATSFTPTSTYTTGTPASITAVSYFQRMGNILLGWNDAQSADSNGATAVTVTLPQMPPDRNIYHGAIGLQQVATSTAYVDLLAYIDATSGTDAARIIKTRAFTTATDAELLYLSFAWISEIEGWTAYDIDPTWQTTTLTPTTATEKGFYAVYDGMCFFTIYLSSADGNAALAPTFALPVPPAQTAVDIPCMAYELVNASTYSNPGAYVASTNESRQDRLVNFKRWSAMTDGAACAVAITGWYPVEV